METMFVPEPVMSLAIKPKKTKDIDSFGKALTRFVQQVLAHICRCPAHDVHC